MEQQVKLKVEGQLSIYLTDKNGKDITIWNGPNAVQDEGLQILAKSLSGDPSWAVNQMRVFKASGLLAEADTVNPVISGTLNNKVKFTSTFSNSSFNDTLDELWLTSKDNTIFSKVTGLSLLKDDTNQLTIEWTLTITFN